MCKVVLSLLLLLTVELVSLAEPGVWPKVINHEKGVITVYQPQIDAFNKNRMEARSAVSVLRTGANEEVFGTVWFSSDVMMNRNAHEAELSKLTIDKIVFAGATEENINKLKEILLGEVPQRKMKMTREQLIALVSSIKDEDSLKMSAEVPRIKYTKFPTVVVSVPEKIEYENIKGVEGVHAIKGSSHYLFKNRANKYYLFAEDIWYESTDLEKGWKAAPEVPPEVGMGYLHQSGASLSFEKSDMVKRIYVTSDNTVVVSSDGEAKFKNVDGVALRYIENSQDVIFQDTSTREFYVMIAGRWYGSPTLSNGTWKEIRSAELPPSFAEIDEASDMGWVKIHVAGTTEAKEAKADAIIPHTEKVEITTRGSLDIKYDGRAKFAQIKGIDLYYAVNTADPVFRYKSKYYTCIDAVWYVSDSAMGPWMVATKIPAAIYQIPEDHPHYNVTHVYIYEASPDYVYVSYTSGYHRVYVYNGCVVYGAGLYYAWRHRYRYHYRYHHPCHYSRTRIRYNSSTGRWGIAHYSNGRYSARIGRVSSGNKSWFKEHYNKGNFKGRTRPAVLPNKQVKRPSTPARTVPKRATTLPATGTKPSVLPSTMDRVSNGNVYSDRKGNVYRNQNGKWQQRQKGTWSSTTINNATKANLNKASKTRNRGTVQTRSASTVRRSTPKRTIPTRSAPVTRGGGRRR